MTTATVQGATSVAFLGYSVVTVTIDAGASDKNSAVKLPSGFTPMSILPCVDGTTAEVTKVTEGHWSLTPTVASSAGKTVIFVIGK